MEPMNFFITYYKDEAGITESVLLNLLSDLINSKNTYVSMVINTEKKTINLSIYKHGGEDLVGRNKFRTDLIKTLMQMAIDKQVHIIKKGFLGASIALNGDLIKHGEYIVLQYDESNEEEIICLQMNPGQ